MAGVMTAHKVGTTEGAFVNLEDDEWDRIMAINLGGIKNCLRAELRHASPNGCSIVNAGSVSGQLGSPFNAAYGVSKAGVMSLSVSGAQVVGRLGIRVNAIAP